MGLKLRSQTLRESLRVLVFEKRVLGRIFGPKRDVMTGGRRKFHNEDLYKSCFYSDIVRMIKLRSMGRSGM